MSTLELVSSRESSSHSQRLLAVLLALWMGCGLWLTAVSVHAQDDAQSEAKALFERGVALSQEQRWAEAAAHFERSVQLADRASTRFNLVRAYSALGRSLDVARHALAFLALPPEPRRADARKEVEQSLQTASRDLSILTIHALPPDGLLLVDGAATLVRDALRLYLLPGAHRLELRVDDAPPEVTDVELGAGQTMVWPRHGRSAIVAASAA